DDAAGTESSGSGDSAEIEITIERDASVFADSDLQGQRRKAVAHQFEVVELRRPYEAVVFLRERFGFELQRLPLRCRQTSIRCLLCKLELPVGDGRQLRKGAIGEIEGAQSIVAVTGSLLINAGLRTEGHGDCGARCIVGASIDSHAGGE